MGRTAVEYLIGFIEGLDDAPANNAESGLELARRIAGPPGEDGDAGFDALMDTLDAAARRTFEFAGPGYLAYIPGGGLYTAALGDFLATGAQPLRGAVAARPGAGADRGERRAVVVRRCSAPPEASQGLLTPGGSMANFSAVVTARRERLGEDFLAASSTSPTRRTTR